MKLKKALLISLLAIVSCFTLYAAEVGSVKFDQSGSTNVPKEMLIYNLWLKPGRTFSEDKLNEDIKRLYKTGYFTDVNAVTTKASDGKINIIFKLANTPKIAKIEVKGNKEFDSNKILDQVTLHTDSPLNDSQLKESTANIRKLYEKSGYYEAKVFPQVKTNSNGMVDVTFKIIEETRLRVDEVNFTGNTVFSSWTLSDTVDTHHSYFSWLFDWGLVNNDVIDQDKIRLRNLYWSKGYLDFSVKDEIKIEKNDPIYAVVTFNIFEGKPYKVTKVGITGNTVFTNKELEKLLSLKKGQTYNYDFEQHDIKALESKYARLGYADFACRPVLEPDYDTHTVTVTYEVNEGLPYTIHDVTISGNKMVKDYVIRRELPLKPGAPVDSVKIDAGKSRLMAMNYFSKVDTYTTASGVKGEKNVNYLVKEKGTSRFTIGGGYSTSDSLVGRVTYTESDFDITDPSTFFRGGGQRLSMMAQFGLTRSDGEIAFTEPWLCGIPLSMTTKGFFHQRDYEYWNERHIGFDLSLKKTFMQFNSILLGYNLDFVNVSDMSDKYSQAFIDEQEGNSRRGALRLELARDTTDSIFSPTSGYRLSFLSEANSEITGGSSNYYKIEGRASGYWNFLDKFFILHLGAKGGTIGGIGSGVDIPIYERYFLGGQDSIRGFDYMGVSPLSDTNHIPVGGLSMFTATADVEHPIYKWIKGDAFVDVGNAWADSFEYGTDMNVGIGYGLRITIPQLSPAPLRLDFAYPIYRANDHYSDHLQFYFSFGVDW